MLVSLGLIFLCGLILGSAFQRLKLPRLIGMLITGIVLGPYVLNALDSSVLAISAGIREIALVIILTRAGLSLDLDDLKKVGRPAAMMSFIPACFEMLGTLIIAPLLFNLSLLDAAILAAVVASASPAVIVPRMIKLIETKYGTEKNIPQLILAGDSVDDIFNIVVFTSLVGLATGGNLSLMRFVEIPISIITGVILGIIGGLVLVFLFKKVHIEDTLKVIILLSLSFLWVGLESMIQNILPISGLVSVMVMGVIILRKIPITADKLSSKFSKLWMGAEVMLFVLVGASVNIGYASSAGLRTILLIVLVLVFRAIGILICLIRTNLNWKERLFCTLTGIPKATVQAAIGGIPLALGLPAGEIILAVAVVSILFTAPLGAFILDSTYEKLLQKGS